MASLAEANEDAQEGQSVDHTRGSRRLRQRKPNFETEWDPNSEEGWIETEKGAVSLTKICREYN